MEDVFAGIDEHESTRYDEGWAAGAATATRRSYADGARIGLAQGFRRGFELGILSGRARVWSARFPASASASSSTATAVDGVPTHTPAAGDGIEAEMDVEEVVESNPEEQSGGDEPTATVLCTRLSSLETTAQLHALVSHIDSLAEAISKASQAPPASEDDDALEPASPSATLFAAAPPEALKSTIAAHDSTLKLSSYIVPTATGSASHTPRANRLSRHASALVALTDARTLDASNADAAVEAWDGRARRAEAKARVVASILCEPMSVSKIDGDKKGEAKGDGGLARKMGVDDF